MGQGGSGLPEVLSRVADGEFGIGIYAAYLPTLGGGENLLAVLAQCLEQEIPAAQIDLITHATSDITLEPVTERFGVDLRRTRIRRLEIRERAHLRRFQTLRRLLHERDIARASAEYDLFVNGTIFSLVPPRSPLSLYMCMFPINPLPPAYAAATGFRRWRNALYLFARRHAIRHRLGRYDKLLSISEFTRSWIRVFWQLDAQVLHPPVDTASMVNLDLKRKRILAIGRFFPADHNKKHDVLIEVFRRLLGDGLEPGWELHLVGGRTTAAGTDEYIDKLKEMARGFPIHLHIDAKRSVLQQLLVTSSIFWHATGYGEDERKDPYRLEHFGMSTVEAMSHGCVPVVYAAGGQPEVVEDGVSGYLWRDRATLIARTLTLAHNPSHREELAGAAHLRSRRFDRATFSERVREILLDLCPTRIRPLPSAAPPLKTVATAEQS